MSTKALKRELAVAIAMLLVAIIALSGSTYAWFASNTQVTAGKASISATTDVPYLLISKQESANFATSIEINDVSASALKLTTPLNLASNIQYKATAGADSNTTPVRFTNPETLLWGYATSDDPAQVKADAVPVLVQSGDLSKHVLSTVIYIKTNDNTVATNLKMAIPEIDSTENSIAEAYRILAVTEDGKYNLYDKGTSAITGDTALVENLTPTAKKITVYFYFDGVDDQAYTNQATNLADIKATLKFVVDGN